MKLTLSLAAAAVLLSLLSSCNPGSSGLFASIEVEKPPTPSGDISGKATVTSMAQDATYQYAVGNGNGSSKLYRRTVATLGKWATDDSTTDPVVSVAGQGNQKVYRIRTDGTTGKNVVEWNSTAGGKTWTPVTIANDSPTNLVPVIGNDGYSVTAVLVVTQNSSNAFQYVYLLTGSGTVAGSADLSPAVSSPVTSAAANGGGYLFVNRSALWTAGAGLGSPAVVTTTGVSEYSVVLKVSGVDSALDGIYLATRRVGSAGGSLVVGTLTSSTVFGTDTTIVSNAKDALSALLDFTALVVPPFGTGVTPDHLLAGTLSSGFGELDRSTWTARPTAATVDVTNYDVSALPSAAVLFFFVSPTPAATGTLFLGTNSQGLWSQSVDKKTWSN